MRSGRRDDTLCVENAVRAQKPVSTKTTRLADLLPNL